MENKLTGFVAPIKKKITNISKLFKKKNLIFGKSNNGHFILKSAVDFVHFNKEFEGSTNILQKNI